MKKSVVVFCVLAVFTFVTAFSLCVAALSGATPVFALNSAFKIVLDAGHGGVDGGVSGKTTGVAERDINLAVTLKLKDVLQDCGFDVVLTRKTSSGLYGAPTKGFKRRDMEQRKAIIEKEKPDLVLSIHQNYYPSVATRGAQVFYGVGNETAKALATVLQTELNELYEPQKVKNRAITAGEYYILKSVSCPSVIVECGFLSSPADEKLLLDETWQRKLAEAIGRGVLTHLESIQTAL